MKADRDPANPTDRPWQKTTTSRVRVGCGLVWEREVGWRWGWVMRGTAGRAGRMTETLSGAEERPVGPGQVRAPHLPTTPHLTSHTAHKTHFILTPGNLLSVVWKALCSPAMRGRELLTAGTPSSCDPGPSPTIEYPVHGRQAV